VRVPVYVGAGDRDAVLHPELDGVLGRVEPGLSPPSRRALVSFDAGPGASVGGLRIQALPVPGHTPGSTCVLVEGGLRPLLFTGDTLFAGRTGRCDLPGGSRSLADASLLAVLAPLADDTVVLPGHGGTTTIGAERLGPLSSGSVAAA
jgi:glyoxylase-like metal-dependent hydrolase (beta-lactamase superfamily II)